MVDLRTLASIVLCLSLTWCAATSYAQTNVLDLQGYAGEDGAISVQYQGDTIDPYFALQALLLAHDHGLDISAYAKPWAHWLVQRQKPDATFDRFCRNGPVWAPCKTADADDALLALWLRLLDTPALQTASNPRMQTSLRASYSASRTALQKLLEPKRGIYLVSPVYQHGLFMDNLEVLSWHAHTPTRATTKPIAPTPKVLAANIQRVFWDSADKEFLVSTQAEQKTSTRAFYPDSVAQILPLLFNFNVPGFKPQAYYTKWMRAHRSEWLHQSMHDFSWGLIAIIALKAKDITSASCWLRETALARHTSHWIATDEVARQILLSQNVKVATHDALCR
jgi:hypothetical protein